MTGHVLAFAALAAVLVVIPGPAVILVLKSAVMKGRLPAIATALGVLAADVLWAITSVLGLTALLVSSQLAFDLVRVAGAAYLIYLGLRLVVSPAATHADPFTDAAVAPATRRGQSFVEGFLNDLSNPKTVIVYASVIPQFLGASSTPLDLFALGIVFAVLGFLSLLAYAVVFGAARGVLTRGRWMRRILRTSGAVLAAFGVGLLVERPSP